MEKRSHQSKGIRRGIPAPIPVDDYFLIELSQGRYAKVCACHVHLVVGKRWQYACAGYAVTHKHGKGVRGTLLMHRVILGLEPNSEFEGDHRYGDKLDNRCSELRVCNGSQNVSNKGKQSNNKSGYKGVVYDEARNKWRAEIAFEHKRIAIGRFDTKEEAALAYNKKAYELHGEYARLNVVKDSPQIQETIFRKDAVTLSR